MIVGAALDLLQVATAIGVVVLVSWRMLNVDIQGRTLDTKCVLDGAKLDDALSGTNFCIYGIGVGIASLIALFVFGFVRKVFKCVTLNACAASKLVSIVGDAVQIVWWAAAFTLFFQRGTAANDLGYPRRTERDGIIALAFGGIVFFLADVVVGFWAMKSAVSSS